MESSLTFASFTQSDDDYFVLIFTWMKSWVGSLPHREEVQGQWVLAQSWLRGVSSHSFIHPALSGPLSGHGAKRGATVSVRGELTVRVCGEWGQERV